MEKNCQGHNGNVNSHFEVGRLLFNKVKESLEDVWSKVNKL